MELRLTESGGVYAIVNVITGDRYVGATTNIFRRWESHRSALRCGKGVPKLQAAWNEYGEGAFWVLVVKQIDNPNELNEAENHYLAIMKPEYNIRNGSSHSKTPRKRTFSPESLERMRAAKANISDETRAKMSAAKKGKAPYKAAFAAAKANRGKQRSPEVIEKIRAAQRERWARKKEELLANAKRDAQGKFTE